MGKSMEERIAQVLRQAASDVRGRTQGHEVNLSVQDYEHRIKETRSELTKLESRRDQAELDLGTMLSNGASEKEGNGQLGKVNELEKGIRKTRATLHSYTLRMGQQKREDEINKGKLVVAIERYGTIEERFFCRKIDAAAEKLAKACFELKEFRQKVDQERYKANNSRTRPFHGGYAISQLLIALGLNEFLHLGPRNREFYKGGLFETLHPLSAGTKDAVPPVMTEEDREQELHELIAEKRREVEQRADEEDTQQNVNVNEDEKPVAETKPLPEGAQLICEQLKIEKF